MKSSLRLAAHDADFIHSHSLWSMPTVYPAQAVRGTRCRLLVSPRGTLDPWAWNYHRYRKKLFWLGGQRRNLVEASCLHATAPMECEFIRGLGLKAPIAIVPNGVDIPDLDGDEQSVAPVGGPPVRRLLYLARIHPKKGVDILLKAWRNVQERFSEWELWIVGFDDGGHLPKMRRLTASLGAERVTFTGWVPEYEKSAQYRSAELYILPTHAENWAVSVADALAHGVPAIVSRGAPWSGLETHGCGWWIDNSVESVTESLKVALSTPPEDLRAKGTRGRAWMAREFSWTVVGKMMQETYGWLLAGGTRPNFVITD